MRVLITGARGQVGQSLREHLPEDWEAIFTDSKTLDITNYNAVDAMIQGFQPNIIINTAAYTNVVEAENNSALAFKINADGVKNLALSSNKIKAKLIHISTDFVFDGNLTESYTVSDSPNPINVYGKSKLAGELMALAFCADSHVIRTSSVYSEYGNNFVRKILSAAQMQSDLHIVKTPTKPTYAGDLAQFIIGCVQHNFSEKLLHFTGPQTINWSEFAKLIISTANHSTNVHDTIDQDVLRPKQTLLNNSAGADQYHTDLQTSLASVVQHLIK